MKLIDLYHNSSLKAELTALIVFVVSYSFLTTLVSFSAKKVKILTDKTSNTYDNAIVDVIESTSKLFIFLLSIFIALTYASKNELVDEYVNKAFIFLMLIQTGVWLNTFFASFSSAYFEKRSQNDPGSLSAFGLINFLSKFVIWSIVLLLILDNLGLDISALVTGLGVGGVAVALAVQNVLGDLFASLSIILDKPFVVGDFIIVDDMLGSVEKIGIKTTRLRSISGEQLIVSNSDLLSSRIKNYKRMDERRAIFQIGVTYDTSEEKLKEIPSLVKTIIESKKNVRFDRAHFKNFGDFSLNFEIVYYILSQDFIEFMNVQEEINLEIFSTFNSKKIEFAFPTQTLHIQNQ